MAVKLRASETTLRALEWLGAAGLAVWFAYLAGSADRPFLATAVGAAAAATFVVRRRHPWLPVVAVLLLIFLPDRLLGGESADDPLLVMLMWSGYSLGRHGAGRQQALVALLALVLVAGSFQEGGQVADIVFPLIFCLVPWLTGWALRASAEGAATAHRRADTLAIEADLSARQAEERERLRIAGDLHDVLGHSLTAVSLRSQAARRAAAAGRPVTVDELHGIEVEAQQAMADLRRIVGLLGAGDGSATLHPPPRFSDLPDLIERFRDAGGDCRLRVTGSESTIPPALSAVAYRILQEALTNARRHGRGPVTVDIAWGDTDLGITVANRLREAADGTEPTGGSGIAGMRERVETFGGSFDAGRIGDEWRVAAQLPLPAGATP